LDASLSSSEVFFPFSFKHWKNGSETSLQADGARGNTEGIRNSVSSFFAITDRRIHTTPIQLINTPSLVDTLHLPEPLYHDINIRREGLAPLPPPLSLPLLANSSNRE
jgi:hypothetical protein